MKRIYENYDNTRDRALSEPAVPEGWKLVPIEPDEKMCKCGDSNWSMFVAGNARAAARKLYRAMLAAAPEPDGEGA